MRIAIDASRAVNEKAGVGRFTRELIENLLKTDKENQYILLFNFWKDYSEKEKEARKFKKTNSEVIISRVPGVVKERLLTSPFGYVERMKLNADLYLAPTFLDVDLKLKIPQIVVIHDLTIFKFPEHLGENISRRYQKILKKAVAKVFKIVTISESAKKDLMEILEVPPSKIEVIYPGFGGLVPQKSLPLKLKKKSYILNVGTIEPRKNLENLLEGYSMLPTPLKEKNPLVICGASGWRNSAIYKKWQELNLQEKVIFAGYLSDQELAALYQNAACFIYPSLYEGFGLPVLEALSFSLPVITSKVSSLPEVGGRAVSYVDPKNTDEIKRELKKILTNKKYSDKLSRLAKAQAKRFSWEKAAKAFIKVFKSATI